MTKFFNKLKFTDVLIDEASEDDLILMVKYTILKTFGGINEDGERKFLKSLVGEDGDLTKLRNHVKSFISFNTAAMEEMKKVGTAKTPFKPYNGKQDYTVEFLFPPKKIR